MNAKQLNFAYKVRHALNENLDNLPESTTERLASARKTALSRKKKDSPLELRAFRPAYAGQIGNFFSEPLSWISRISLAVPVIVLAAGLIGIYQVEQQQRLSDIAEIDTLVLADELPLSAYVDHGFNAYLARRGE
ncbi:MAG TPA: DUF3619 family protein [Burkholderiaceae bacterium]|nr:DUF3619 family protein [Burkholderiaceae bacterium]